MSEQANARHKSNYEIEFGMMHTDEKGHVDIPPKYEDRIKSANWKDSNEFIGIKYGAHKKTSKNKENQDRIH